MTYGSRAFSLIVGVLALNLAAGCRMEPEAGELIRSSKSRVTSPGVTPAELDQLTRDNRSFAFDLYAQLRAEEPGNLFFSPHSISTAMAMVFAGARGNTESELQQGMHFGLGQSKLHEGLNALDLELGRRGSNAHRFALRMVNQLWGQKGHPFEAAWLDTLALHYGTGVRVFNFAEDPELARTQINDWVAFHTNDRITDLLPEGVIEPLTRAVLTNAIYFDAGWATAFDAAQTRPGDFHLLDGSTRSVQLMRRQADARLTLGDGYAAVELPYQGDELTFLLLLPDAGRFEELETGLNQAFVDSVTANLSPALVDLRMPRFSFKSGFALKPPLEAMGIRDAFTESAADFSGIDGTRDLYISTVIHQAFIDVTEDGTEAAAATAVVVNSRAASAEPQPVAISADRPFMFLIRDVQTGAVLFVGRVLEP